MYSKRYIDIITLIIVSIILILVNLFQIINQNNTKKVLEEIQVQNTQEILNNKTVENVVSNIDLIDDLYLDEEIYEDEDEIEDEVEDEVEDEPMPIGYQKDWYIIIPKIDLIAPIEEGTTEEILNKSVGHFKESTIWNGNVCLAAHNRGYNVNYFEKLKQLLLNDVIIYQYGNSKKTYSVSNITIIKETDWSYIESKKENKITLITCVEDEPDYRLCVQATEIK